MMHQKKIAKLKKFLPKNLHSIPISKVKNKLLVRGETNATGGCARKKLSLHHNLAYVSYSIPLLSSLALLVVGLVATSPFSQVDKTSAIGNVIDVDYQRVMRSTATLTITPATSGGHGATNGVATEIIPGSVGYRAHDVLASVSDSTSYMLNLSYTENDKSLHLADGNMYLDPVPYDGVEGSENMAEDNWGFAWGDKESVDADMTYYQVPQYNQAGAGIKNGILELDVTGADRSASIDKKLVFAANFSPNTISGHYVASILLSLSATPNDISRLSELTRLQDITPQICRNSAVGETTITPLVDSRDGKNKEYSVIRASDDNCWFRENLALNLNSITLTPADSNVKEDWAPGSVSSSSWISTNYNTVKIYKLSESLGYLYSFNAATAGQGSTVTTRGESVDQDICPKGWRLPKISEYQELIGNGDPDYNGRWSTTTKSYVLETNLNTLIFPATGYYSPESGSTAATLRETESGFYWSSTVYDSQSAYGIYITNNTTDVKHTNLRNRGLPVRCMAKRLGED